MLLGHIRSLRPAIRVDRIDVLSRAGVSVSGTFAHSLQPCFESITALIYRYFNRPRRYGFWNTEEIHHFDPYPVKDVGQFVAGLEQGRPDVRMATGVSCGNRCWNHVIARPVQDQSWLPELGFILVPGSVFHELISKHPFAALAVMEYRGRTLALPTLPILFGIAFSPAARELKRGSHQNQPLDFGMPRCVQRRQIPAQARSHQNRRLTGYGPADHV